MNKAFLCGLLLLFLGSCSQFSSSPTSKAWHNTNARYNALFIAKEDFKLANYLMDSVRNEDFTTTLPIWIPIDTLETAVANEAWEEIIKMTSLIAERHSNSRYLDKAYTLLGIARFHKADYLNAIEVFKYVNSNGSYEQAKNEALIWLMRSYIEQKNFTNAEEVSTILSKNNLDKENKIFYYKTVAYLNQLKGQKPLALVYLDEAIKLQKKSKDKARNLYIAGRIYNELGQTTEARKRWLKVSKNRPDYQLEFNTNIELLTSTSLAGSDAGFSKMLEDRKNTDLKEKIYLKKGEANLRKNLYNHAIADFQEAARLSSNKTDKATAYRNIADIYYLNLKNYEKANTYYDSTLQNLNSKSTGYEDVKTKSQSLSDFIIYTNVLKREDSLQKLAAMNPLAVENMIDEILQEEIEKEKRLTQQALDAATKREASNSSRSTSSWFMYDPVALTKSRNEFIRTWGNRALEDHWRRKNKQSGKISFAIERGMVENKEGVEIDENEKALQAQKTKLEQRKKEFLDAIPNTAVKLAESKRKQEEAYYQLGKIYKYQFVQETEAKNMFVALLNNFPESIYEQEVLYFLALMEKEVDKNEYKTKLLAKYPYSTYARQLKRGIVDITADTESNAERVYADLYDKFKLQPLPKNILEELNKALLDYTGTSVEDKIAMLRLLTLAKLGDVNAYRIGLLDFSSSYPTSNLLPRAKQMLITLENGGK